MPAQAYNKAQAIRADIEAKNPQVGVLDKSEEEDKEPPNKGPEPPHAALRDALLHEAELEKKKLAKLTNPGKAALADGKAAEAIVDEAVVDMNTAEMARQAKDMAKTELADDDALVSNKEKDLANRVNDQKISMRQSRTQQAAAALANMRTDEQADTDVLQASAVAAEKEHVKQELADALVHNKARS